MSGMCGAVHWDGEPVDRAVLTDLTRRPVLETYGSLHAVTHMMGGTVGKNDGGGGPDKTGFYA